MTNESMVKITNLGVADPALPKPNPPPPTPVPATETDLQLVVTEDPPDSPQVQPEPPWTEIVGAAEPSLGCQRAGAGRAVLQPERECAGEGGVNETLWDATLVQRRRLPHPVCHRDQPARNRSNHPAG